MRVDAFDYDLPADRIAQRPTRDREEARLTVLPADGGEPVHTTVAPTKPAGDGRAAFVMPELLPTRDLESPALERVAPNLLSLAHWARLGQARSTPRRPASIGRPSSHGPSTATSASAGAAAGGSSVLGRTGHANAEPARPRVERGV